jgi:hypothetical protein
MSKVTGSPKDETAGSRQFRCARIYVNCIIVRTAAAHRADGREEH